MTNLELKKICAKIAHYFHTIGDMDKVHKWRRLANLDEFCDQDREAIEYCWERLRKYIEPYIENETLIILNGTVENETLKI